jgi:predicted aspartyl protease
VQRFVKKKNLFLATAYLPFKSEDKYDPIDLVVDTGAGLTIVDTAIVDYLGYSAREDGIDISALDGAAGRSEGYVIKVSRFKCLGFELENFAIACHDMNTRLGVAGLLGMNFLEHFRIDMNYGTGEIYKVEKI